MQCAFLETQAAALAKQIEDRKLENEKTLARLHEELQRAQEELKRLGTEIKKIMNQKVAARIEF